MIIHIVKYNENINIILNHYKVSLNDLMSMNQHITDWSNITPGMKLRIPLLNKEVLNILEDTEPFIEEYYPSISNKIEDNPKNEIIEEKKEDIKENKTKKPIIFPYYYYKYNNK